MYLDKNFLKLWEAHPDIYELLLSCRNVIDARLGLYRLSSSLKEKLDRRHEFLHPLDYDIMENCLSVFKTMISERSEKLSEFSLVQTLWAMIHENDIIADLDLSRGFIEEIRHLFLGIRGQSDLYNHRSLPLFLTMRGRDAALLRSKNLEEKAEIMQAAVKKYPTGLDPDIQLIRRDNTRRILDYFGATYRDWSNYKWQLKNVVRDSKTLSSLITLTSDEREAIDLAKQYSLPFGITPYYISLMDRDPSRKNDHAVRAQVIPPLSYVHHMIENRSNLEYSSDFMLEHDTSPVDYVTRRYPNIAILKPFNTCSQICVYCQRNWEIDDLQDDNSFPIKRKIDQAIRYFELHPGIDEVLLTGGDPLVMREKKILRIIERVAQIDHIKRIRLGSRVPVTLPMRITSELIEGIASFHIPGRREIALVTHFEHVYEITEDAMRAVQLFKQNGISVYNQTVFTIENSRRYEGVALRKMLRLIGVDPYYTFNTKGKDETNDYRVPIARLLQEMKEEARLTSGLVRTDAAVYNVPRLGKNYLPEQLHHRLISVLPDGKRVYEFLPWESKISLVDTYIDTDVPIYNYLQELKRRGENPDDYESIYYYF